MRLRSQELKDQADTNKESNNSSDMSSKIISRLDALNGKCNEIAKSGRKQLSDIVKESLPSKGHNRLDNKEVICIDELATCRNQQDRDHELNEISTHQKQTTSVQHNIRHEYDGREASYAPSNLITLTRPTEDTNHALRIEPIVSDNDTSLFRGLVRRRTKRIVLYNIRADKPFELVSAAVTSYAAKEDVKVTFTKLLKRCEIRGSATYTMRVNIAESDFGKVESNDNFWPTGVYWRDYIPYSNNKHTEQQWS